MKQLLILSGKGGTGKTTIAASFIKLAKAKAYADCDIDAPNLHLVLDEKETPKIENYYGMPKSKIDTAKCIKCGKCKENCRFNAIEIDENGNYVVNNFSCEGCGVCELVCENQAVTMVNAVSGETKLYKNDHVFSTAELKMGSGTSGKLVSVVKKNLVKSSDAEFAIVDGSPGIGCPVIASLAGVKMVLVVTEPSLSGMSDMKRIIESARQFGITIAVCINKYDINEDITRQIEKFCKAENIKNVGKIPFDKSVIKAVNSGKSIVEIECPASEAVKHIYNQTIKIFNAI